MFTLQGLVGFHRTVQLHLLQHYWLGHRLGLLCYIEWFALEMNRDDSVIFEIVPKYYSTLATSCEELTHWKRL